MIEVKEPRFMVISIEGNVGYDVDEKQVANIIDSALRERSVLASINIKPDKHAAKEGFSTAWDIWSEENDRNRRIGV